MLNNSQLTKCTVIHSSQDKPIHLVTAEKLFDFISNHQFRLHKLSKNQYCGTFATQASTLVAFYLLCKLVCILNRIGMASPIL